MHVTEGGEARLFETDETHFLVRFPVKPWSPNPKKLELTALESLRQSHVACIQGCIVQISVSPPVSLDNVRCDAIRTISKMTLVLVLGRQKGVHFVMRYAAPWYIIKRNAHAFIVFVPGLDLSL